MPGALTGIRVIDLARGIAGPYAALLLAEQGADVLKLEPSGGDPYRSEPGFHVFNRGKQSAIADLENDEGHAAALRAIGGADLLIYDGSPLEQRRLGLTYDSLAANNPALVYCWLPPFGSRGPHAERFADDALVAALGGVLGTQWSRRPGPTYLTVPLTSYGTALLAAGAASAAIWVRQRTGYGQLVEVSWLAGSFAIQTGTILQGEELSRFAGSGQNPLGPLPVYRIFRAADGKYLFIACGHAGFFHRFCLLIDRADLISDPRYAAAPWGMIDAGDREALARELEPIIASRPCEDWLPLLAEADIPCAPVATRDDYLHDPAVLRNGMRVELDDPELGRTVQPGTSVRLLGTAGGIRSAAPRLGNHAPPSQATGARRSNPNGSGALPAHALAGLKVLDLSAYIAGSLCPMMLADWGADVVKVEGPDGDPFRASGFGFLGWNRGKRSIVIDLKHPEGRELVYDLARDADIVVENFRPGVSERLGVDYATLRGLNRRLIYSSETAFGGDGPDALRPGFDPLLQARSGVMAAQGGTVHGQEPVYLTIALCDYGAALLSTFGILAALVARERTGDGQRVATTLTGSAMAMQAAEYIRYDGAPSPLQGGADFVGPSALCRVYEAQDGWILLAAREAEQWLPLTQALDRIDLLHNMSPFEAIAESNHGELAATLEATFLTRTVTEWLDRCDRTGVPIGPVLDGTALFGDPHIAANELITVADHPVWGTVHQTGQLVKFSRTPGLIGPVAPLLGQHTQEVLRQAGISEGRIAGLLRRGIVMQHQTVLSG
jgi:crotonobetainyl-CoA:carnitine CoA-transferase CaiB-like acyl-CoA transferase